MAAQLQLMRSQLEQLHAEVLFYRGEGTSFDELQVSKFTCFIGTMVIIKFPLCGFLYHASLTFYPYADSQA